MEQSKTVAALAFCLCISLPAAAAPPDALINNTLSLPAELSKSIMVNPNIADIRGEVWPYILGVAAVDLALQAYFYGVYVPLTRRG